MVGQKNKPAVNAADLFGHACYRFISPVLKNPISHISWKLKIHRGKRKRI